MRTLLLLTLTAGVALAQVNQTGRWSPVVSWPFIPVAIAHLPDGRVMGWASTRPTTFPAGETFTYASIYDPATGQFTTLNNTAHDMFCAGLAMTGDGRVLAPGGGADVRTTSTIGVLARWGQRWQRVGDMWSGRWYNSSVTLPDGNVMTMWGRSGGTLTELFDQQTGTWSKLTGITIAATADPPDNVDDDHNWYPHMHYMPNGKILMAGPLYTMRWLDPTGLGSWQDIGSRTPDGTRHRKLGASVQFLPGKILFTGGRDDRFSPSVWRTGVVIDTTGAGVSTTATGSMAYARAFHNLVVLPNGEVFAAGGNTSGAKFSDTGAVLPAEIWNPGTGQWRTVSSMTVPRGYHMVAILLRDGRVLVGGGGLCACGADHPNSQIYEPGYLFNADGSAAARPAIDLVSPDWKPGITVGLKGSDNITGFRLIRLQATTHGINADQRHIPVNFTKGAAGNYNLTLDGSQNVLLPGMYWLFALTANGVPSMGYPIQMFTASTWPGTGEGETNLAKGKAATQSSTDGAAVAARAVDGSTNGDMAQGSVSATQAQSQPYWQTDLGADARLSSIRLWNRTDCCAGQLANFHVFVSRQPIVGSTVAEAKAQAGVVDLAFPGTAGATASIPANVTGRYVRVQLEGTGALALAEVEALGTVVTNAAPAVTLTAPANGATYTAPASIVLSAQASDGDGNLARVEFYNGATKLGEATAAPFSYAWNGVAAGTYTVTARAVDALGAFSEASATVVVNPPAVTNQAPTVSVSSPVDGITMTAPAGFNIDVTAADVDGNLARVELLQNGTKIAERTAAPFQFAVSDLGAGTYVFTARAVDTLGASASATVTVRVLTRQLQSLKGAPVPEPATLASFVKNRAAAIALGKALFWDTQVSSDGSIACGSCHFHAGSDARFKNQMNPGTLRTGNPPMTFDVSRTGAAQGPNYTVKAGDFPRHVLSNPLDANSAVVYQSKDVMGSHGVMMRNFTAATPGAPADACVAAPDPVFGEYRRSTGRNTPTVLNAVFNVRNFWDGRANARFNGVDGFGPRNTAAVIYRGTPPAPVAVSIDNASLASQAVTAPVSSTEMSCAGRTWPEIGRRLLSATALARQTVSPADSVLGVYAAAGGAKGLDRSYEAMVRAAFADDLHAGAGPIVINGASYTQLQANFALFFGLAVQLYEATLVTDQAPIDSYFANYPSTAVANGAALSPEAIAGMNVFTGKGRCASCHHGPQLTNAGTPAREAAAIGALISRMRMGNGEAGAYDLGFYNVGVRPAGEDLGVGGTDPFGNPFSFTRQAKAGAIRDAITVDPCTFEADPCAPLGAGARDVVDGAFKTPTLRNIALTGPYFHNGSVATLEEVVEFYDRGGNATGTTLANSTGYGANATNSHADIRPLALSPAEKSALVTFLKTALTDDRVLYERAPFDHPELPLVNSDELVLVPAVGSAGRAQPLAAFHELVAGGDIGYPVVTVPPVVAIVTPVAGAGFVAPASVSITATATTTQGGIARVEFLNGTSLLGTVTAAPFTFLWSNVAAGAYTLTARAIGTNGTASVSAPVSITVTAAPSGPAAVGRWPLDEVINGVTPDVSGRNVAGTVSGPYSLVAGRVGQAIQLNPVTGGVTTASSVLDPTRSFSVALWVNLARVSGTQTFLSLPANTLSTFYLQLAGWLHGGFAMEVYPRDVEDGASAVAPSVTIPAPNRWYHLVGVYDAESKKVRLFVDGQLESEGAAAQGPFANPGPLAMGFAKYNGQRADGTDARLDDVRVFDRALSAADVSAVYGDTGAGVGAAPVVSIVSPAAGASFIAPATVAMAATATTTQGTISKVEFFNGTTLLGTATAAPYTFTWTNVAAGTYALTAKATGSNGTSTTSAALSITVATPTAGPGPAGRWPLDSVALGLTADLSANSNAGIVTGAYTLTAGTIGQAIQLDPGAGGITTQRQVINSTQSYSVALWVKLSNTSGTQTFVSLPGASVSTFYLQLAGWLHGGFAMDVYPSDSTAAVDAVAASSTIPVANRWYHLAGVYDASAKQVRIYVNGVLDGQASAQTGSFANSGPLSFGFAKWNGNRADGTGAALDDVRVYDKALTATEVLAVYNDR